VLQSFGRAPCECPLYSVQTGLAFYTWYEIQGYSKRSIHFQKFVSQVLLNTWRRSIFRLKGELSKLFSRLTSTRCAPHVQRGRCQIDNPALRTLVAACHSLSDAPLQIIDIRTLRDFLSIRTQDMDLASVVFVKLIFESVYFFLKNSVQSRCQLGVVWAAYLRRW
jgi:hypothetical protein